MNTDNSDNYKLPNGQWIQQVNSYETEYVFNEIFVDEVYLQHGIKIRDNAVVFDVGANIGLFSLYVKQNFPTAKIYAFEPAPIVYSILQHNTASLGSGVHLYNVGLADNENKYPFYYYPGYSVISGFYANKKRDAEIIISGMKANTGRDDLKIESLVKERLEQLDIFQCQVTTISNIIRQNKISTIDLLKIDVEGAELTVIKGIEKKHWNNISQIVIEVHHKKDVDRIVTILESKLFTVHVEIDERLGTSGIYNLFAIKKNNEH